eukprot:1815605-Amphidinium_carterae.1
MAPVAIRSLTLRVPRIPHIRNVNLELSSRDVISRSVLRVYDRIRAISGMHRTPYRPRCSRRGTSNRTRARRHLKGARKLSIATTPRSAHTSSWHEAPCPCVPPE